MPRTKPRCWDIRNKLSIKNSAFYFSYPHDSIRHFLKMYNEILGDIGQTDLSFGMNSISPYYCETNFQQKLKDKFRFPERNSIVLSDPRGGFKTDENRFVIRQSIQSTNGKRLSGKKLGMDVRG